MEYESLGVALSDARLPMTAWELHGGLCGALCAGKVEAATSWIDECLTACDMEDSALQALRERCRELGLDTWRRLMGAEFEFCLLLPSEHATLPERVSALALWCHGFLSGLGLAAGCSPGAEPSRGTAGEETFASVEEIMADFAEISRAGLSAAERRNVTEADFALAELIEYVRVSVQIVFEELEPTRAPATTLH